MKTIKKTLIWCAGIILVLYLVFFFWIRPILGREIILNQIIPENANTTSELIHIADVHISKYLKGNSFHIGSVLMELDLNHEGQVRITYVSEREQGIPDVYTVHFDTVTNRLIDINKPFREDKNNPGNLNFNKWKITDSEAFRIALESFNNAEERFDFENYNMLTIGVGQPSWWVIFYQEQKMYRVRVDAFSGEVINQGG
ncbi:PepSY domain-containing protein [Paenibacillus yanchengensis]|uniref:PepSY domain-containing protein n=1 Tax=Paenibacillus yanchengensis TaxID=2035833 RepID=A0ABW4YHL3_9BACL